jgi:ATP-dependent helicase/DNAse subunit B
MLKLSVSSMDTYEKCPKKYHYNYIEKPNVIKKKWGHTEFGSCAHKILELFHQKYIDSPFTLDEAAAIMKESFVCGVKDFDMDILCEKTWSPDGEESGITLLKKIMQKYLNLLKSDGFPNVIGIEKAYSFTTLDGVEVRGFIDRIDKVADGHYEVVDYKTSKSPAYLSPRQLKVYAEYIKRNYPDAKKISGKYIMLKLGCKSIDWNFSDIDLLNTVKDVDRIANAIKNESTWLKKPTALCTFCDYRSICQDTWGEEED